MNTPYTDRWIERFWSRVQTTGDDTCWPWLRYCMSPPKNYGQTGLGQTVLYTHRVAYELIYGAFAKELCVLHKCDNPPCCNPSHLFLGSKMDNNKDMANKGRRVFAPGAKLTWEEVRMIRLLYSSGTVSQRYLSQQFNIGRSQISYIVNFKQWKEI